MKYKVIKDGEIRGENRKVGDEIELDADEGAHYADLLEVEGAKHHKAKEETHHKGK